MRDPEPGGLVSRQLMALISREASRIVGPSLPTSLDKTATLECVAAVGGMAAVFSVGLAIRSAPTTPMLAVMDAAADATVLVDHWRRLERFGHSRRRTVIVRAAQSAFTLQHLAPHSEKIPAVDDLFLWGLLCGLLERCGALDPVMRLSSSRGALLYADGQIRVAGRPRRTDTLHLSWTQKAQPALDQSRLPSNDAAIVARVQTLLARDPARRWRVSDLAAAMDSSPRSLQRHLAQAQTSLSRLIARARLEAATALMQSSSLTLTEIAFMAGYADSAHLTRSFRAVADVPPSALRALLARSTDKRFAKVGA